MFHKVNTKKILSQLTESKAILLIHSLGAETYTECEESIQCTSVCHQSSSHKLYYYKSSKSFYCHKCGCRYSIFDMIMRVKNYNFPQSIQHLCDICGIEYESNLRISEKVDDSDQWKGILNKYNRYNSTHKELKIYDKNILKFFPKIYHQDWIDFGISIETMEKYQICYYPYRQQIVIPVFDENGNLVGIRGRNMIPEFSTKWKYIPIILLNNMEFSFPISNIFYGVYQNLASIKKNKKVILYESEKSVLLMDTWYGEDSFALALFGKSLQKLRRDWIINQGIEEVIIAIDFDYENYGDADYDEYEKSVFKIADMFEGYCRISVLCSHIGHTKKDSPCDNGKVFYEKLWNEREDIY